MNPCNKGNAQAKIVEMLWFQIPAKDFFREISVKVFLHNHLAGEFLQYPW